MGSVLFARRFFWSVPVSIPQLEFGIMEVWRFLDLGIFFLLWALSMEVAKPSTIEQRCCQRLANADYRGLIHYASLCEYLETYGDQPLAASNNQPANRPPKEPMPAQQR